MGGVNRKDPPKRTVEQRLRIVTQVRKSWMMKNGGAIPGFSELGEIEELDRLSYQKLEKRGIKADVVVQTLARDQSQYFYKACFLLIRSESAFDWEIFGCKHRKTFHTSLMLWRVENVCKIVCQKLAFRCTSMWYRRRHIAVWTAIKGTCGQWRDLNGFYNQLKADRVNLCIELVN